MITNQAVVILAHLAQVRVDSQVLTVR